MRIYLLLNFITLYLSSGIFITKAGGKFIYGLIPVINIYFLIKVLKINPLVLITLGLLLIFSPFRTLILTIIYLFFPFILADAYIYGNNNMLIGFLTLLIPFLGYIFIVLIGDYEYEI